MKNAAYNWGRLMSGEQNADEIIFNVIQHKETERFAYKIIYNNENEASKQKAPEKSASKPDDALYIACNEFVSNVTSTTNAHILTRGLISDFIDSWLSEEIVPSIRKSGKPTEPVEGFTEAYVINESTLHDSQEEFTNIGRGIKAKNYLSPVTLLSIAAQYDVLISSLISTYYNAHPESLNGIDKTFTLSDLRKYNDFKDVEKQVIQREVDSIMFGSHKSQIEWLDKRMKLKIDGLLREQSLFLEIFERRNLCAHTDRIISQRYIDNCRSLGVPPELLGEIGSKVIISQDYIRETSRRLVEYGIILAQAVWRKLFRADLESVKRADDLLLKQCDLILGSNKPKLAGYLLQVGYENFNPATDYNRRLMVIRRAACFIADGEVPKAQSTLSEHDWSASDSRLRTFVHAIMDDFEAAAACMKITGGADPISADEFLDDPAFQNFRETDLFRRTFFDLFGKTPEEYRDIRLAEQVKAASDENQKSTTD